MQTFLSIKRQLRLVTLFLILVPGLLSPSRVSAQAFTDLHTFAALNSFTNVEGAAPFAALVLSGNRLYGTASGGGADGGGTVFAVNTDGSGYTNLFTFAFDGSFIFSKGADPVGNLILAGNTLYGTTEAGGTLNWGTVFSIQTDGTGFTNLHNFGNDGKDPMGSLILAGNTLYGTTFAGGTTGRGLVFGMNITGAGFTNLHSFTTIDDFGRNIDGANPNPDLLLSGSTLYGTALNGGTNGYGTVFSLNTNGTGFKVLYSFTSAGNFTNNDGGLPYCGLTLSGSTLYGATRAGGSSGLGTIYAIQTDGTGFTNLHNLAVGDGAGQMGGLLLISNTLFGTTTGGGSSGSGTVFSVGTNGSGFKNLYNFAPRVGSGSTNRDGAVLEGSLIVSDNVLYGTARFGGAPGSGTLFSLDLSAPISDSPFSASPVSGTVPLTVGFTSPTLDANGNPIVSWFWDFDDDANINMQNPSHLYTNSDTFFPSLVMVNLYGDSSYGAGPSITVDPVPVPTTNPPPTLVAYYSFDDGDLEGTDFSGNGNNLSSPFPYNGGSGNLTSDAETAPDAVEFHNNGGTGGAYYYTSASNIMATISGSFSISLWLKTTQVAGNDTDLGFQVHDAGIVSTAFETVIPMALTGGKLAFVTDSTMFNVLHSVTSINTGDYMHVVVTRDEETGQKQIYINGALDASDVGETGILNNALEMDIGSGDGFGFDGDLDEIQVYTGVLSSNEVQQLYNFPGTTLTNGTTGGGGPITDLGVALNATNLVWSTGGDADWYVETTNTFDGVAAQSGLITDSQTSFIETTVPADGQVSFYWKVSSEPGFDYLTFYINDVEQDAITAEVDWNQETYPVSAGDTLRWEYSKDDSVSDGNDAGWLDQVTYTNVPISYAPVSVNFSFQIEKYNDQTAGFTGYSVAGDITSISPAPTTTNLIESPDGLIFSEVWAGDSAEDNASGEGFDSLTDLIYACTNAPWTLYVNKGDPGEQVFHFNVSIQGLTTNVLVSTTFLKPTANAVNVPTNSPLQWAGPVGFSSIFAEAYQQVPAFAFDGFTDLAGDATNWPSPPPLLVGENFFYVSYASNLFQGITFSTPVRDDLTPVVDWETQAYVFSDSIMSFVVSAATGLPIELIPTLAGANGNFQLSFQTQSGQPETVWSRTNLIGGDWIMETNITGDGSVKQFVFPTTNAGAKFFRVTGE